MKSCKGAFFGLLLAACITTPKVVHELDTPPPVQGDVTLILSGCGNSPSNGFMTCRYPETAPLENAGFRIHKPQGASGEYRIIDTAGQELYGNKADQDVTFVYWKNVLKTEQFVRDQRGIYGVSLEMEGRAVATGVVMLRILDPHYVNMNNTKESKHFNSRSTFSDKNGTWMLKYTKNLRSSVQIEG